MGWFSGSDEVVQAETDPRVHVVRTGTVETAGSAAVEPLERPSSMAPFETAVRALSDNRRHGIERAFREMVLLLADVSSQLTDRPGALKNDPRVPIILGELCLLRAEAVDADAKRGGR